MGTKKLPEDVAIKRRGIIGLLSALSMGVLSVYMFVDIDWIYRVLGLGGNSWAGIVLPFVSLAIAAIIYIFVWEIRYFYCPKCKSLCDWKPYRQRTDDLTTRRQDGQVDRRYSSVLVSWYNYEYDCTNKDCGYKFTEWQREKTGPTWTEIQKF